MLRGISIVFMSEPKSGCWQGLPEGLGRSGRDGGVRYETFCFSEAVSGLGICEGLNLGL